MPFQHCTLDSHQIFAGVQKSGSFLWSGKLTSASQLSATHSESVLIGVESRGRDIEKSSTVQMQENTSSTDDSFKIFKRYFETNRKVRLMGQLVLTVAWISSSACPDFFRMAHKIVNGLQNCTNSHRLENCDSQI